MTTLATAISVRGIEKSYKDLQVLRGVDLEVERQRLRAARLERRGQDHDRPHPVDAAQSGCRDGQDEGFDVPTHVPEVRQSINLTGQFAAVDEILTGRENLVLVARLRHVKDAGRIADDLLSRFALTDAGVDAKRPTPGACGVDSTSR